jgi:molybdate transport system substrate-binding protein
VTGNVVSFESSVRGVLAKVSMDQVDAGVVYVTDARSVAEQVCVLAIPDRLNVIAEYPIARLADSERAAAAERFVSLALSDAGEAILAGWGFEPPGDARSAEEATPRKASRDDAQSFEP